MANRTLILSALVFSSFAHSSVKIDLSGLGNKSQKTQVAVSQNGNFEEEVISSKVYSSAGSDLGVRRNIELVKPRSEQFQLDKDTVIEPEEESPSALAFVDDALGIEQVKPWEKGTLAKKEMKPGGLIPEFDLFSEKVFAYKQGTVGGSGVGGGGCGCN